jgi:Zn-dependent M28 family amino/carboxypeptidase
MWKTTVPLLMAPILVNSVANAKPYRPNSDEKRAASMIREEEIRGHVRFLSSDLLEGRGVATEGDRLAEEYIASQFETLGLKPAAPGNSWFQPFDVVGVDVGFPKMLRFRNGAKDLSLRYLDQYVGSSGSQQPSIRVLDAEVVFVGYGIVAPEFQWDDYKGDDLKGKILLFMNDDPSGDPNLFSGKTRLYYGRWTYKYEMAAKLGAAGAIVIHTKESAGYPWKVVQTSWDGEQFSLPLEGGASLPLQLWVTDESAKGLAKLAGFDLDQLRSAAEKRDFRPVHLKTTLSVSIPAKIRRVKTANVLGLLPGSDPKLSKEIVVYMAHHDHLGKNPHPKKGEDPIYHGALDNASGVGAMISIARAFTSLERKPKRSILFAGVAGEEDGLLGSEYLANHGVVESGKIAAAINIDGVNIWGRSRDITMIGKGKSTLDGTIERLVEMQGRVLKADQFPEKGYFYRSDQFNFARLGVPSAVFDSGIDIIGKPPGWGKEQVEKWEEMHYHQPSDRLTPDWNLEGAIEDLRLDFHLGYAVADAPEMPKWNPGDEFEAIRRKALSK